MRPFTTRLRRFPTLRYIGLAVVLLVLLCFLSPNPLSEYTPSWLYRNNVLHNSVHRGETRTKPRGLPFADSWGAYSPYRAQAAYSVPHTCEITMANIIQRHGARYPTDGATERILAAMNKMTAVPSWSDARFSFISTFKYELGMSDLLPHGARQSSESGSEAAKRYRRLGRPFVRSSDSERVNFSASNWTLGFSREMGGPRAGILKVSEEYNTTLDDHMCPGAPDPEPQKETWAGKIAPAILRRLRALAQPPQSLSMDPVDIPNLMSLCAFDTLRAADVDTPPGQEQTSPWCGLWTQEEVEAFEYWLDLDKWYKRSYGNALGPVQGIGYVAELLARLTRTPVSDWDRAGRTSVNHTLDDRYETFPLDRQLYVDFSHDNHMVAILAALGVLKEPAQLDPSQPDPNRAFVVSRIVPFAGRMVFEKLRCDGTAVQQVRLLINDAPVRLPPPCPQDGGHLCGLEDFISSQAYARSGAQEDWARCQALLHHRTWSQTRE